jgi:exonuclease SbcC
MRPLRIELEGFSAYRAPVEVDFAGADFFSLTGPTGSGKSSLIDAMVFALFGRVPRLGGNAVAPAITAGADQARVRLDFESNSQIYSVVRMAVRTASGGATVREARLEQGDRVLASGADDVTREVEGLLKLRFEDFTRTVVLPQGDFARFLTATKAERQGLLRNLLGLDIYTRVRDLAKERSVKATERAAGDRRALEALELGDEESRQAAVDRRDALVALEAEMPERESRLTALDSAVETARDEETKLAAALGRVRAIAVPPRLDELDALIVSARSAVADAEEGQETAAQEVAAIETAISLLPSRERLEVWEQVRARITDLETRIETATADDTVAIVTTAEASVEAANRVLEETRSAISSARMEHAAHALAANLVVGAPCPVCTVTVEQLPETGDLPLLSELESVEQSATAELARLRLEADQARADLAARQSSLSGWVEQRDQLLADLAEAPTAEEMTALHEQLAEQAKALETARSTVTAFRERRDKARSELESLADDARQAAKKLTTAQLTVADLDPPVSESDDVIVQWKDLMDWAATTAARLSERAAAAAEGRTAAESNAAAERASLVLDLQSHGLEPVEPFAVQVAKAVHAAETVVETDEKALERAAVLTTLVSAAESEAAVADTLAAHLRSSGFEQWLMAGALAELVDGANHLLDQLSGGGYSLNSDDSGTFSMVDHRNADEVRSVATLSGGETFLVSLALALSLAETLAAKGGSGLDAIILDEGFGTLDDESLEIVATVLEELTGRGLMVGVITHVKELAARAPVRFEVTREPGGAVARLVS